MTMVAERPARAPNRSAVFTGMALASAVAVLVGFSPTYFLAARTCLRLDRSTKSMARSSRRGSFS